MATAELGINIVARNQAKSAIRGLQSDLKGLRGTLGDIAKFTAGNLIAGGITAGVSAITSGAKAAVGSFAAMANEAADFGAQISSIAAISGASTEQLGELKQLALDLGVDPNLKVSATEAAQAIEMLARNGLKVPQIMDGAAKATVLLANATGADFSTAADIGTDAMALFGIQANEMMQAVDGIVSVTNNSKFSINDYALALAQGGGVAATVGVSFDDFNATIAGMAPLFASGSDAGTSFKTFLQRLVPQTDKAADAMKDLGLVTINSEKALQTIKDAGIEIASTNMDDIFGGLANAWMEMNNVNVVDDKKFQKWLQSSELMQSAFFNANGEMKDMASIAGELNSAIGDLTEEQKILTLSTIFGSDAMRAAAGLAGYTEEEFRALQKTMGETSAIDGAATRMDNLAGDMEIFRSVVESVRIQIGDKFQPVLRDVFQGGSQLVADLAPSLIGFAGKIADAIDAALGRIQSAKQQFDFLASSGNFAGGILAGVGTLTGGVVDVPIGATVVDVDWGILKASFDSASQDLSLSIGDIITGTFNLADHAVTLEIGDFFTGTFRPADFGFHMAIGDFFTGEFSLKDRIAKVEIGDFFAGAQLGAGGKLKFTFNDTNLEIDFGALEARIAAALRSLPDNIYTAVGGLAGLDFGEIASRIGGQIKALPNNIYAAIGGLAGLDFGSLASRIGGQIKALPESIFASIGGLTGLDFGWVAERIAGAIQVIPDNILIAIGTAGLDFSVVVGRVVSAIKSIPDSVAALVSDLPTLDEAAADIRSGVESLIGPEGALTGGVDLLLGLVDNVSSALGDVDLSVASDTVSTVAQSIGDLMQTFNDFEVSIIGEATATISNFVTAVTDMAQRIVTSLDPDLLATALTGFVMGSVDKLTAVISNLDLGQILGSLAGLTSGISDQLRQVFETGFMQTIGEAAGNLIQSAIEQIAAALANPAFGQGLGEALTNTLFAILRGSFDALSGLADGLSDLSGNALLDGLAQFALNFVKGIGTAVADVDWSGLGKSLIDALVGGLEGAIGGNPLIKLLTAPGASLAGALDFKESLAAAAAAITWPSIGTDLFEGWPPIATALFAGWPVIATSLFGGWPMIATTLFQGWPSIPYPTWDWPAIPYPGWLDTLVNIFNKGVSVNQPPSGGSGGGGTYNEGDSGGSGSGGGGSRGFGNDGPGTNAIGTRNWRGGLSWVGETGPELVALPRGSRIFSNSDSMALAGGGGVNVTVNVGTVANDVDIQRLAYQIADIVQRRRQR